MQHYTHIPILFLIIIFLGNCNLKNTDSDNNNTKIANVVLRQDSIDKIENSIFPIYIDKNRDYEEKKFTFLQDIGKVEYVKLETNDSCLLRASYKLIRVHLTDQDIFLSTGDNVVRFDRKGKFINSIGKKGPGPLEIVSLFDFFIDETKQEVHILEGTTQYLKTYYFDGKFKNKIRTEISGTNIGAVNDSSIIYTNFSESNNPMAFHSSLNNGKITKQILPIRTIKNVTGLRRRFVDKFTNNLLYNNKVIYQNFINDTTYTIDRENLTASSRYIQLPPNTGLDGSNSIPFVVFETDRYAYIIICKNPPLNHNFIVDKKENKIYKGFVADADRNTAVKAINTNIDNVIVDLYDTFTLQDFLEKEYLNGKLKEIAETLGDDDNPILMIATIDF